MNTNPTKQNLTEARRRLVELMQWINYGRIESLSVAHGEPVFAPPTLVVREIKFGGDNLPRPEISKNDFVLKTHVRELFAWLEEIGDGVIMWIEIQRGLPFRMKVEEEVHA